jgi:hypothetical protein
LHRSIACISFSTAACVSPIAVCSASANVSIRQHTSAIAVCVSPIYLLSVIKRQHTSDTSAYVRIRPHTSASTNADVC